MQPKHFSHAVPFLPVKDLKETITYYKEKLGFYNEWFWGNPPSDAGIQRDNLRLLFNQNKEYATIINSEKQAFEVVVFVQNVDAIFEEYKSKRVKIVSGLKDEPWGVREFTVKDVNGYFLRITEGIEKEKEKEQ